MLQLQPPRFLPIPRRRVTGRRRRACPVIAFNSQWKIPDVDTDAVRERVRSWMSLARGAVADAAHAARERGRHKEEPEGGKKKQRKEVVVEEQAFVAVPEVTVEPRVAQGWLSLDAVVSIEQFARLNGLTGRQVQRIFETLAPKHLHNDARSLVEYSCFRYLARDNSDFHPNLKELAFQKLIFVTMLAWEDPYNEDDGPLSLLDSYSVLGRLVGEDAFVRIAPAVAGVADVSTAHYLFRALVGAEKGLSFDLWTTYLAELLKVHHGRQTHQMGDNFLYDEKVLCIGSSKKRPVLKWEENTAWPGSLTLTDKALYFEAIGLSGTKKPMRLDLTNQNSRVEKTKVGPFGSKLFDSAVSVSSGSVSDEWTLEFVDFSGEMRRDVWLAFISEIISVYRFIREYGPGGDDPAIHNVYGAYKGKKRAVSSAANSIARLQSLQFIRRLYEDPAKLVQFSYLSNAPFGDVVLQTLAVNFWGGPLTTKARSADQRSTQWHRSSEDPSSGHAHVYDIDGSVYLRKWMTSPSWASSHSANFWRNSSVKHGVILSKSLVVADKNLVEKAMVDCKERSKVVERTQATIVAATIEGIPSNIDLFKELMLPFAIVAENFKKLQRWENPRSTFCFLLLVHTVLFRNMLSYVFPFTLMMMALSMLAVKGLKEQGRLGRSFGKVTIRDQPPSNTIHHKESERPRSALAVAIRVSWCTGMAATAYSVALLGGARLPAAPRSALLPRRSVCQLRLQDAPRLSLLRAKAASEDTSASGDELIEDLKAKWDAVEDKPTVLLYGGGAIVALWLTSVVVGAINAVPLLPKILELVGLGYTGWFVYRYLLFKESRKELAADIETLKKKIAGTE